jgi:hypothetical protein
MWSQVLRDFQPFAVPKVAAGAKRTEEGILKVTLNCVPEKVDGIKNPDWKRAECSIDKEMFDFLNTGPLPTADERTVLDRPNHQTSWFSINVRALAAGRFHLSGSNSDPDSDSDYNSGSGDESSGDETARRLARCREQCIELEMRLQGLQERHADAIEQIKEMESIQGNTGDSMGGVFRYTKQTFVRVESHEIECDALNRDLLLNEYILTCE